MYFLLEMRVLFLKRLIFLENTNAVLKTQIRLLKELYFILGNAYFILKIAVFGKHEYRLLITRALEKHGLNY